MSKGIKQLLAEANDAVDAVTVDQARQHLGKTDVAFVDVRESSERAKGHIPGSIHVPRGFLEFMADPESPMHNPVLSSGKRLVLYCASGGRSALAGKTLQNMGITDVVNLTGGMNAWSQAGGEIERDNPE
jgi:rhodanese-related sulfurtransferase